MLLGTRQVVTDSRIDDTRIVLIGFSYGGYLANRIATRPNPFAAIICWEGHADPRRLDRNSVAIQSRWRGGSPMELPERWAAAAPLVRARQVRVPMALVYGDRSPLLDHGKIWFQAPSKRRSGRR